MAGKYDNGNTKITDHEIKLIMSQYTLIDEQLKILYKSKKDILKAFNITFANYCLRKNVLIKAWEVTKD